MSSHSSGNMGFIKNLHPHGESAQKTVESIPKQCGTEGTKRKLQYDLAAQFRGFVAEKKQEKPAEAKTPVDAAKPAAEGPAKSEAKPEKKAA